MADLDPRVPLVQFPFTAGIIESTRAEVVDGGAGWLVLENGRQDQRGGYSTRNGFTYLPLGRIDATSPTAGYKLFSDGSAPCRIADNQLDVYSQAAAKWVQIGRVPEATYSLTPLTALGTDAYVEDVEVCNGYLAAVYNVSDGASTYTFAALLDATTMATVRAPEQLFAGNSFCQLASYGTKLIAMSGDNGGATITLYILDLTSATTVAAGWSSLATISDRLALYGISACSLEDRIAVAYVNDSAGASQVTVKTYDSTGLLETATVNTSSVTPRFVDVAGSNADTLWVAWDETTSVKLCGLTGNSLATVLATTATAITLSVLARNIFLCPSTTAGAGRLAAVDTATTARTHFRSFTTSGGAAVASGSQVTSCGAVMAGKPWRHSGRYYAPFFAAGITGSNATSVVGNLAVYGGQQTFIICDWTDDASYVRPVVNVGPGLTVATGFAKSSVAALSATKYVTACTQIRSAVAYAPALVTVDFADTKRWQTVAHGDSTFIGGGVTSFFDGQHVSEAGFLARPTKPTTATSATGITATTGWRYVCVYEQVDADGNWHQSGLSDPSASTGAVANKTVTVTTTPLGISSRGGSTNQASSVRVAIYRTADGAVAPYYRLATVINDPSTATLTYADTTTDADLTTYAQLYSQPGVVGTAQDHRPPPGMSILTSYNGMLVGAEGSNVWFSGEQVYGEGAWFNPIFQVPVPGEGSITALFSQDGTLYACKRKAIYAIVGEAPNANGSAGGLGTPRRLAVDVGCIDSRSVCTTALGTFFQSDRGIEVLTRAQSVDWIGEAVQETLSSYPIVTSATVDPVSSTVLVECAATEASGAVYGTGRTLVHDLTIRAWISTDRRHSALAAADAPSQSAAMIYTGSAWRYGWLAAGGYVHYETPGTYLDADGAMVCKRAVSGNVKFAGLQGLQHVNKALVLARYHTPHDLNLSFAYDYSSTFKTARLYTAAQLLALTSAIPNMQLEHGMHNDARCEAVRVQLQDVTPSSGTLGTGQGATWIAVALEIVPQTGAYKLPDKAR